jgi:hypothetical protein
MHAREDYAHAAAVERILHAYGVTPQQPRGGGLTRRGRPLWGRGTAVTGMEDELRVPRPQPGGC